MYTQKYKTTNKEKLLEALAKDQAEAASQGVNGIRKLVKKYIPHSLRLSLVTHSPEFFLLYYLGFRLPAHQCHWIKLWRTQFLIELAPRDHGKSWMFSYGLPLYDIYSSYARSNLRTVDTTMLQVSKTDTQAEKYGMQVRETIESNLLLKEDFGDIRDSQNWFKQKFRCKRDSTDTVEKDFTYEYVGVLGSITGGHFRRIILDDVLDDENTKLADRMAAIENWFWGTIWNMREGHTSYTVVGTRKNRRDLYSRLMDSPIWTANVEKAIIKFPMIPDPSHRGQMMNGWLYLTTANREIQGPIELRPGEKIKDVKLLTDDYEVLWPPTLAVDNNGSPKINPNTGTQEMFGWGIKQLLMDRAAQGALWFDREKQNTINAEEGSIFNKSWFVYFDTQELVLNQQDGCYYLTTDLVRGEEVA